MTSKLRTLTTAAALALLIAPTGASAAPVCPPRTQPTAVTGGDPWFAVCPGRRVTIRAIDRPCGRAGADRLIFRNSRGRRPDLAAPALSLPRGDSGWAPMTAQVRIPTALGAGARAGACHDGRS